MGFDAFAGTEYRSVGRILRQSHPWALAMVDRTNGAGRHLILRRGDTENETQRTRLSQPRNG